MNNSTWKDGELAYCERLVAQGGNRSVPADSVGAYLRLQMADAARNYYATEARALRALLTVWAAREVRMMVVTG